LDLDQPTEEVGRLQRCLNDLVGILALPALWTGRSPSLIARTLVDALSGMLSLDLGFVRLADSAGGPPIEMAHAAASWQLPAAADAVGAMLHEWLGEDPREWPPVVRQRSQSGEWSVVPLRLGLNGELGLLVACSSRPDFPLRTERLVLTVAANQAAVGLQEARELIREAAERRRAEVALRETEREWRLIVDHIPGLVALLSATGDVEVVNRRLVEYFGQTLEELRRWGTNDTVHPGDLPHVIEVFTRSIQSASPYTIVQRFRRSDGVYRWFENSGFPLHNATGRVVHWCVLLTDIDERKHAEDALRASERESRLIVDSIPGLVAVFGPRGELEFVSRQILDYFGRTLGELKRWGTDDTTHPEDNSRVVEVFTRAMESGKPFQVESRARRHDGVYRWFQSRGYPLRDQEGHIIRWYNLLIDIDERKRAEEALTASEQNLKLTIDTIPALAWATDPDGSAEFFNQHYLDFVGLSAEQARDWGWMAAVHPDDLGDLAATWKRIMASGAAGEAEARLRRHDGVYRWFLLRASPLRDDKGQIVKWYGVNTDIEDRKRAEAELRRSEAFLAEAQRLSLTGSFSWRVATDEITWSNEVYRIFELDPVEPLTFVTLCSRVHPDDLVLFSDLVSRARSDGAPFEYEKRLLMPDGSVKYLHVVAHATGNVDGSLEYIGAIQDVTERRRAQEELDRARSELTRVARITTLGTLAASIAHEVNQPLSGIVTNASTCLRMLAAEPPNIDGARETARRTIRDGHRASEVVNRLRGLFSRKEVVSESVDLNAATREVIALTASELRQDSVVVREELTADLPSVVGDRVQLQQVILNLLLNAADAMRGVNDRARELVVRTGRDEGGGVGVWVHDSGVGFAPEASQRLFEAFYTTKAQGMGIGLSVSRSIIERHGGRLWATHNDGSGATFAFSVPADTKVG
jgi:PAS domain S-box-containing protein